LFNLFQTKAKSADIKRIAESLANVIKKDDILLLNGDLGSGKTTFARHFINQIYIKNALKIPRVVSSPTFPILIIYELKKYNVYHYDLYRLKNINELQEIEIFENFKQNISLIEWPDILLKTNILKEYYLINFNLNTKHINEIKIEHTNKKKLIIWR